MAGMKQASLQRGAGAMARSSPARAGARLRRHGAAPALCVSADPEALSRAAAAFLLRVLAQKPDALVCLASGASPARTYQLLAAHGRRRPALFARVRWLQLDEWGGLAEDDPATCRAWLQRELLDPLRVPPGRFLGWSSQPSDPAAECRRVSAWLARHGPIDVAVLGVGTNGHLGLNEPAGALQPGPHVARLSPAARRHSMLSAARRAPRYGLTLGMADLLQARQVVLLVSGGHKARVLRRFFNRQITPAFPVSFLWLHPAVALFCDKAAAAGVPPDLLA